MPSGKAVPVGGRAGWPGPRIFDTDEPCTCYQQLTRAVSARNVRATCTHVSTAAWSRDLSAMKHLACVFRRLQLARIPSFSRHTAHLSARHRRQSTPADAQRRGWVACTRGAARPTGQGRPSYPQAAGRFVAKRRESAGLPSATSAAHSPPAARPARRRAARHLQPRDERRNSAVPA